MKQSPPLPPSVYPSAALLSPAVPSFFLPKSPSPVRKKRLRSVKSSAQDIFGAGFSTSVRHLNRHTYRLRKKSVKLHLEYRTRGIHDRDVIKIRIKKIHAAQAGAKISVQRDANIAGSITKCLSVVADDRPCPASACCKIPQAEVPRCPP